jgi:signal transduction histidine kinase
LLLLALVLEARRAYLLEQHRAEKLAHAYTAERDRVEELERLDRAKADLFSMVTHELAHPVAAVRALLVASRRALDGGDGRRRDQLLDLLDQETARLRELTDEAAAVLQLESKALSVHASREQALNLVTAAVESVEGLRGRLEVSTEARAEWVHVTADRARVLQVLRNLLSNAEKYSTPGTRVVLAMSARPFEVEFSVTDLGPGIAPDDQPRLFQRFSRIRTPATEEIPGSGLGLYICRQIVEQHGGRIWVESVPGRGSSFRFTLPRNWDSE